MVVGKWKIEICRAGAGLLRRARDKLRAALLANTVSAFRLYSALCPLTSALSGATLCGRPERSRPFPIHGRERRDPLLDLRVFFRGLRGGERIGGILRRRALVPDQRPSRVVEVRVFGFGERRTDKTLAR